MSELLIHDDELECTQRYSDEDIVQNIVAADGDERTKDEGQEEDCRKLGMFEEQLRVIAWLNWISVIYGVDDEALMHALWGLEETLRAQ